jgi:hypothetical protein
VVGRKGLFSGLRCQHLFLTLSAVSTKHQLASQLKTSRWPVGTLAAPCTSPVKPRSTEALQRAQLHGRNQHGVNVLQNKSSTKHALHTAGKPRLAWHGLTPCTSLMQLMCSIHIAMS